MTAFPLANLPKQDSSALADMVDSATPKYLGRLSVQYGVSDAVVQRKAQIGDYMLGDKNLGSEVKIVVGPFRSHADHWDDGKLLGESWDNTSAEWRRLSALAKKWVDGVKAGPEFLVYIPGQKAYATLRCARTTLKCGKPLGEVAGKLITLGTTIQGKKNKYPVYEIVQVHEGATYEPCNDEDYAAEMFEKFLEPTLEKKGNAAGGER